LTFKVRPIDDSVCKGSAGIDTSAGGLTVLEAKTS